MAGGHGGYRRPSNPAPVSGPGAMSKRTDGGPTQPVQEVGGFEYGGRKDFVDIQGGAPIAASDNSAPMVPPTPLFAPTERPDEPITAGAPIGPGPGPSADPAKKPRLSEQLRRFVPSDESGDLGYIADVLFSKGL